MVRLADLSWPDVADRAASGAILAVPVGATEQHGPHLPLTTDTDIALELCDRLAGATTTCGLAPASRS
ncbi:creatininase family protein, partial [Amycolatopsis lexingtonensis]|uniref:creatininase family protein n=1 Tax=Amycolatopsis lexingtonensis TaxID=218822 RepID=UPI003B849017